MSNLDINLLNDYLESRSAEQIILWAWETFGSKVATSSSMQTQSLPLLHIISRVCPEMPVIFIDTGFHFPETLTFRDELKARYNLNFIIVRPTIEKSQLLQQYGEGLYRRDPDLCCYINKVEPMQKAVSGLSGWISGIRRDQTMNRKTMRVLEPWATGLLRIHPLINWTEEELYAYINKHKLPSHPLFDNGYMSIGCEPCTRPVFKGEDSRAGRWAGSNKTECGLHTAFTNNGEDDSGNQTI